MITKKIINQMKLLVGLKFSHQGDTFTIVNWHIDGDQLHVKTNSKLSDLNLHIAHAKEFFTELKPLDERGRDALAGIEPEQSTVAVPAVAPLDVTALVPTSTLASINEILLDSVRKVQMDASYIPQARAISDSVQVAVNVAKMQLDAAKLVMQAQRPKK